MSRLFEALNSLESTTAGIQELPVFEKGEPESRKAGRMAKRQVIILPLIISAAVVLGAVFYWLSSTLNTREIREAGGTVQKAAKAESAITGTGLEKGPAAPDETGIKMHKRPSQKKQAALIPGNQGRVLEEHTPPFYTKSRRERPLSRSISSNTKKSGGAAAEGPSYGLGRIRIRPSSSRILNSRQKRLLYRAEILRKNGDMEEAAAIYEKIWQQTRNAQVGNNLAGLLILNRDLDKARGILNSVIKINPDDPDIKYNMSLLERLAAGKGR